MPTFPRDWTPDPGRRLDARNRKWRLVIFGSAFRPGWLVAVAVRPRARWPSAGECAGITARTGNGPACPRLMPRRACSCRVGTRPGSSTTVGHLPPVAVGPHAHRWRLLLPHQPLQRALPRRRRGQHRRRSQHRAGAEARRPAIPLNPPPRTAGASALPQPEGVHRPLTSDKRADVKDARRADGRTGHLEGVVGLATPDDLRQMDVLAESLGLRNVDASRWTGTPPCMPAGRRAKAID